MLELNHRVKNNLLMISSLINLKNSFLGPNADLTDLIHQVDAIRIIHEKLYQSENIMMINLKEYLSDLLGTIFSFSPKRVKVQSIIEIGQIKTKTAIPVGLIVNEAATNAVKHGFPDTDTPEFSVSIRKSEDQIILALSNNGSPFPDGIDLENPETLGLRLISALVDQLDGTIDLIRRPNPAYTIRFPV
jgi:two-component sensor histidine kinase